MTAPLAAPPLPPAPLDEEEPVVDETALVDAVVEVDVDVELEVEVVEVDAVVVAPSPLVELAVEPGPVFPLPASEQATRRMEHKTSDERMRVSP